MRQPKGVGFILGTLVSCLISQPDNEQRERKKFKEMDNSKKFNELVVGSCFVLSEQLRI